MKTMEKITRLIEKMPYVPYVNRSAKVEANNANRTKSLPLLIGGTFRNIADGAKCNGGVVKPEKCAFLTLHYLKIKLMLVGQSPTSCIGNSVPALATSSSRLVTFMFFLTFARPGEQLTAPLPQGFW